MVRVEPVRPGSPVDPGPPLGWAQSPDGQERQLRKTRAYIEQMSPEDRAKWGFDDLLADLDALAAADKKEQ